MKALILNGGEGERLYELTRGVIPKGHIFLDGRPLLAYQIDILESNGVKSFILAYTSSEQIEQFRILLNKGLIPGHLEYDVIKVPSKNDNHIRDPFCAFLSTDLREILSDNEPIIYMNGDIIVKSDEVQNLFKLFLGNKFSTISVKKGNRSNPYHIQTKENAVTKIVKGPHKSDCGYVAGGVNILVADDKKKLFDISVVAGENIKYTLEEMLVAGLKSNRNYNAYEFENYINMNEYKDYIDALVKIRMWRRKR